MKKSIKYSISAILAVIVITIGSVGVYYYNIIQKVKSDDPLVWESDIREFEEKDKKNPPAAGSILFVGSSSINFWSTLSEDMNPLPVINRGFGGAKIPDVIHYAPRIVLPYKPKIVVFYTGDNDMSMGRKQLAEEVLGNYKKFVDLVHNQLPDTKIYFISIKPSSARWEDWPNMDKANQIIQQFSNEHEKLAFIDISSSMLNVAGKPRDDILIWDGIHMNAEGYKIWTSIIKPILEKQCK